MSSQGYLECFLDNLICPGATNLRCVFNLFLCLETVKNYQRNRKQREIY